MVLTPAEIMSAVRAALGRGRLTVRTKCGARREVFVDFWIDEYTYPPGSRTLHFVWASDANPEHCLSAQLSVDEMTEACIRQVVSEQLQPTIEDLFRRTYPEI